MKRSLRTKTLTKKSDSIKMYRFRASSHEGIGNPHRKYIYYFYLVQIKIKKYFHAIISFQNTLHEHIHKIAHTYFQNC